MKSTSSVATAAGAALAAGLILIVRRTVTTPARLCANDEQIDMSLVARYRPMLRLLEQDDLEFLSSQPGFLPAMARRLRRQRARIFRSYLRSLTADFQRTCDAVKIILVRSGCDRPDLATKLLRAQIEFALGLLSVYFKLILYRLGWAQVDVTFLVTLFNGMQMELRSLVPESLAAGA
jgi:hypothetical protein